MHQASHARSRAGFTLIELLIVISIIAILAALLLAGISAVRWRGYDAKEVNDLKQLEIALNAFKAKYGVYPPSRLVLYPTYSDYTAKVSICGDAALDFDSYQIINRIWKNIGAFGYVNWSSTDPKVPATFPRFVILEGDQCLVYFLGGVFDPSQSGCMGFAPSAKNPTADVFDPKGNVLDRTKLFEFPASRLNTTKNALFPSFMDNYGQMPYMYFAPGLPGSSTPNTYNTNHTVALGGNSVSPYYQIAGPPKKYWNPTTFQIILAGRDGLFGDVGHWDNGSSTTDATAAWKDNRTNFSTFVLAAQAQ